MRIACTLFLVTGIYLVFEEAAQRDTNLQAYWYRLHDIFLFMQGNFISQTAGKQEGMLLIIDTLPPPFTGGEKGTHAHAQAHKALISE